MRMSFRKVPIQRPEGNFYSLGVISLLWLRFALVLSSLDNNKTIRGPKSCYKKKTLNIHARNDKGLNRGIQTPHSFAKGLI